MSNPVRQLSMDKDQREQFVRALHREDPIQSWNETTEVLRAEQSALAESIVRKRQWKSVEQVKQEYVNGEIADHELDDAIERAMKTKDRTADEEKIRMLVNASNQTYQNRDAVVGFLVVLGLVSLVVFVVLALLL